MANMSAHLTVMIKAARAAARSLRRDFSELENLQVRRKGPADFVSAADMKAEETIFEILREARPKYGLLLEERGEIIGSDNSNRWIVDPLDGTTNFLHGVPQFAISIGLERDREPFAGVVYNPATDLLYHAERGQGAFCNDRRLRVSGRTDIHECLFATGLPFMGADTIDQALVETGRVLKQTTGVRRMGAASLDLCQLAAGQFDAFWERDLAPWDMCAGIIIAREAGATVTDLDTDNNRAHLTKGILASNGHIHDAAKSLILGK
ncbi:MAG: inositol monophosphatase family protein [bacterium]